MQRYAPISKMEAQPDGTIKVWGIASTEAVDNDGEVIKADAMKAALPDYMQWGAIREMHQPIAAGTCLEASVNDAGETIICAHVTDTNSILKVKTGTLKGFSIGGVALTTDPMNKTVVTSLKLNEISLVDKPANPEAVISLWKADKMSNTATTPAPVTGEQVGNEIEALVKGDGLSLQEVLQAVRKAADLKKKFKVDKAVECEHGAELGDKCDKCDNGFAMKLMDDSIDEFCKADYSDEQRATMASAGEAEEDGSYPIKTEKDLENAIHAFGRSKNKPKTKAHIIARAKALGLESKLPEKWHADESGSAKDKVAGAVAPAGGSNEPAGNAETQKAAKTGSEGEIVEKTEGNAEVSAVGPGTTGAPNAVNQHQAAGTTGTENAQADTPMLEKPEIGDLVVIKFGEEEVAGEIKELGDGGSVTITNGDAHLAVDSSKLIHHEMTGTKRTWNITAEENADFLAAKPAAKAEGSERVTAALCKMATGGAGKPIQKGMWTVQDWAGTLQQIVWLCKDIKWEGDAEEDPKDAELAKKIADWLRAGAALWIEYAKDEVNEMLTGVADPDNLEGFLLELAAKPGELLKFANGETGVGHVLKKAFGTNGTVDTEAVQKAIEKAVGSAVAQATANLQKSHDEKIGELNQQIAELKEQPAPMRGVLKGAAIDKDSNLGESAAEEVTPVKKADGTTDDATTAIKKAFQQPQPFIRK